ncbi:hypothetical protein HHK36_029702 [Tetracentron sinense]|uniref:WHIM1 domain-containing protein n=1 Tax=Tetracentron sinense TaxID=13715 RepID=A0A834YBD8_TETSI|nr:hypothetical protein HHK36_029702 [Tetracentron sinense]
MQTLDLSLDSFVDNLKSFDLSTMSEEASTSIHDEGSSPEEQWQKKKKKKNNNNHIERKGRLPRACTSRSSARLHSVAPAIDRNPGPTKKERDELQQCSKIITPLVNSPPPSQLPRWNLRSMWELASLLNFLHIFWPLLNISVEFSAEELETALITPNGTLDDIHIPLLKMGWFCMDISKEFRKLMMTLDFRQLPDEHWAIPPVTRMALGRATWVTVLCRKLRDWWHWVADGEIPIVASHGTEVEVYKSLDPGTRVLILKALCDIRVEQEDIRSYIDNSIKHSVQLSAFRKERIGGDSLGISYWYEDDPVIGHRLYREIRKVEVKKVKTKGIPSLPIVSCQWETVATNLDEFQDVSEKLFSSKNRTEAALGKKLKIDMLPEIEKIHKRKERLLKKQHREALLLDSFLSADGLVLGRSLRDRKPVTYTFDDYDRSITEAIKITKQRQPSPETAVKREVVSKPEASTNGRWNGSSQTPPHVSFDVLSPKSTDNEETDGEHKSGPLDRSNRRRQRPQRYSEREFVEAVSDNEADFDSDDDIVGEAVYDEEYLRSRKQRKVSSSSDGDEEYHGEEENFEDEDEEEEEEDSSSSSEDTDEPRRSKILPSRRSRRETKLRSVGEIQSGLRRSKRSTRNHIDYKQYELSASETESKKPEKSNSSGGQSEASNVESSMGSQESEHNEDDQKIKVDQPVQDYNETVEKEQSRTPEETNNTGQEVESVQKRRYLDLNELAPGACFDDSPDMIMKDEDTDNF